MPTVTLIDALRRRFRDGLSLRSRLALGAIVMVLTATGLVTTVSLALVRFDMKRAISEQQAALIERAVEQLDQKVERRLNVLKILADKVSLEAPDDPAAMKRFVLERPDMKVWFDNLTIFGTNGDLIVNLNRPTDRTGFNIAGRAYFQQTIADKIGVVSEPVYSRITQRAIVNLTAPILNRAGKVVAVMLATIDLERGHFFSEANPARIGNTGFFYVASPKGIFISHPNPALLLHSALPALQQYPGLERALKGFEGTLESTDAFPSRALVSFKQMHSTHWIVAAVLPISEAFAPIRNTVERSSLVALLLALLAAPLTWWTMRRQLMPIDHLAVRFEALRRNPELVAIPQVYARDELGKLAHAFDELMRERLFAETRYQSSAEELRAATNSILDAFYILQAERDAQGTIIDFRIRYLNDNAARLLRHTREELLNQLVCERVPFTRTGGLFDKCVAVLQSGIALQEEVLLSVAEIDAGWLSIQATALADGVAVTARDISQRKHAEIELNDSRAFLQSLIDHLPVVVFSKTVSLVEKGHFVLWNKAAEHIVGLPAEQVLGKSNDEIFPTETAAAYDEHDLQIARGGEQFEVPVLSLRRADGTVRMLRSRTVPLRNADGVVDHILGIAEDITERRIQERELVKKQAELTAVNDASPLGLLRTDLMGHCTYVNRTFQLISGLDFEQAMGRGWLVAMPPDDANRVLSQWTEIPPVARYSEQKLTRFVHPDQRVVWVSLEVAPIMIDGTAVGYVASAEDVTERRAAHAALAFSEQRLRLIADNLPALVAYIDADQRFQFCNAFHQKSQQMDPLDMVGKSIRELFGYRRYQVFAPYITAALRGERQSFERDMPSAQGRRCMQYEYIPDVRPDGLVLGFYSMITDVTARKSMEQDLLAEKELLRVTLNSIGDAVITTDTAGLVRYVNPVAERMTGWSRQAALGLPLTQVFHVVGVRGGSAAPDPVSMVIDSGVFTSLPGSVLLVARDGEHIAIENSAAPIRDADNKMIGVVMVFHDVSQAHVMAEQMTHLAAHDALTGLVNRREFERRLELAVQSASAGDKQHSVLYLDLDQFKVVNDTSGHVAGDELLRQLTAVLLDKLRQTDLLARLGGDEFGILLESCAGAPALRVAELLRQTISEFHFVWIDKVFPISVSIGLVTFSNHGVTTPDVLRMADSACYVAKDKGRNRVHIYAEENAELVHRHGQMGWIARIRQALDANRFVLFFQPMRALDATRHGVHYELLLRMLDDDGKVIPPMAFIPAAERYGLMPQLDRWVIRNAFASHTRRHPSGAPAGICAINLSGTSICDETFLPFVLAQFAESGVPPTEICFEITETAAIANLAEAAALIRELQAIGCKFSLDDFGSGMSSFTYLKHLPVNFLKIDGSFVKDMIDDPIDRAMVQAINQIGHVMGLITIAEFVESEAIIAALHELGVDYAQGYAIGRPQPC